jgi:murein L,D-transpeptidase YafK
MKVLILIFSLLMPLQESFKQEQLKFIRVKDAYSEKENTVKNYFLNKNLNYQGFHLFLRGFKKERVLEVWVKENGSTQFQLLTQYDFCAASGVLGPKRKEGDGQIPEGIYHINHFNPQSNFHLSLGINYPNQSDKLLADKQTPGSAIYIHGNCVTIGCIPITDDKIKELYILAVEATNNGQRKIPVHIFPARLTSETMSELQDTNRENAGLIGFWKNLQPVYLDFEKTKGVAPVRVNSQGAYYF